MKWHLLLAGASAFVAIGCASTDSRPPKVYSAKEYETMTYCVGMSDTARYAATERLKGRAIEDLKQHYASKPNARVNIAAVDKVYSDRVSSAWDYTVSFFNECAQNLANVAPDRVRLASYCMQNQLMADVAYSYKVAAAPKEQAYAHFAQFNSKTPRTIVDWVYASPKERTEIRLDVWNRCMAEVSAI
jgi:hypothetical protein